MWYGAPVAYRDSDTLACRECSTRHQVRDLTFYRDNGQFVPVCSACHKDGGVRSNPLEDDDTKFEWVT